MANDNSIKVSNIELLQKLFGVDEQLKFVETLLKKYEFSTERKVQFQKSLNAIKVRLEDPNLYLAVIGEFNAGKSSLINALLRDIVLVPDLIPATTAAITELRFGTTLSIEAKFIDGKVLKFPENIREFETLFQHKDIGSPLQVIKRLTADEEISKLIDKTIIYHPAPILKEGLIIFDTPGSNSINTRHTRIAKKAIEEQCDAGIILVPVHTPFSEDLGKFLKAALDQTALQRCLFILTQIDRANKQERAKILDTVSERAKNALGIPKPTVQPTTVQYIIQSIEDGTDMDTTLSKLPDEVELAKSFFSMEASIFKLLKEQREAIILERISLLLSELFKEISTDLKGLEQRYTIEHNALKEVQIPNLENYIFEQKERVTEDFKEKIKAPLKGLQNEIETVHYSCWNEISNRLNAQASTQGIKTFLDATVPQIVTTKTEGLNSRFDTLNKLMATNASSLQKQFQQSFNNLYNRLATLGGILPQTKIKQNTDMALNSDLSINNALSSVGNIVINAEEEESGKRGTGIVIGLVAGIFTGGLGWVLGPIIGSFIGSWFGPSVDEVKSQVSASLKSKIDESFEELKTHAKKNIKSATKKYVNKLEEAIDAYFEHYTQLAKELDRKDKQKMRDLERRQAEIAYEKSELDKHQETLKLRLEKLKTMK